ncbi:MAG: response regulator [Elusimicrobiota bacterium]
MSKKVLIVDDDRIFLEVAEGFLKYMGYDVLTATGGEKALELALSKSPDVMLVDVVMPGKSGFEVCREIKNKKETKKIGVIMVSGNIDEIEKGFDYGADNCIIKPVDWNKLAERIKEL